MEMNNSKAVLKAAGIMDFVAGIPFMLLGALGIAGVAAASQATEMASALGNIGAAVMTGGSILSILAGLACVIEGVLAFRAVKDPAKVMPFWYVSVISLTVYSIGFAIALLQGNGAVSELIGVGLNYLVYYAANSMKVAVGK